MFFQFFKFIIAVNHTTNRIMLIEHLFGDESDNLLYIEEQLISRTFALHKFNALDEEKSDITDKDYQEMVKKGISHCLRGDVFQLSFRVVSTANTKAMNSMFTGFTLHQPLSLPIPTSILVVLNFWVITRSTN
jgi:anthranilate/para-aminobenzoate synthase component I